MRGGETVMIKADEIAQAVARMSERRSDNRIPIRLEVEYRRLHSFLADYTANISKGGTFVRTRQPRDVGTQFVFALRLPEPSFDGGVVTVEVTGLVKWVVAE